MRSDPPSRRLILAFLASALASGCTQDARVPPLEAKVALLEAKVASLDSDLRRLQESGERREGEQDLETIAYLTPGSTGYAIVRMRLGHLTVSLANINAYANGSKVTLQLGNPTNATIEGLKATIEWGQVGADRLPNNKEARSQEVTFNESLPPGTWTNTEVVLEGVPPPLLGFVRVREISNRSIRLRARSGA